MGGGLYCMVPDPKTNKQKVLAKWPDAGCNYADDVDLYFIYRDQQGSKPALGHGATEAEAWVDAARRLK